MVSAMLESARLPNEMRRRFTYSSGPAPLEVGFGIANEFAAEIRAFVQSSSGPKVVKIRREVSQPVEQPDGE